MNKYTKWRQIFGKTIGDKRMRDVELILRFLSLYHNISHYEKPMKKFMNDFMNTNRNPSKTKLAQFESLFKQTAEAVVKSLGPRPFHIHRGLNAAVYDSVFTSFARHLADGRTVSETRIARRFKKLIRDKNYMLWVSSATTDKDVVPKRIKRAKEILFG